MQGRSRRGRLRRADRRDASVAMERITLSLGVEATMQAAAAFWPAFRTMAATILAAAACRYSSLLPAAHTRGG